MQWIKDKISPFPSPAATVWSRDCPSNAMCSLLADTAVNVPSPAPPPPSQRTVTYVPSDALAMWTNPFRGNEHRGSTKRRRQRKGERLPSRRQHIAKQLLLVWSEHHRPCNARADKGRERVRRRSLYAVLHDQTEPGRAGHSIKSRAAPPRRGTSPSYNRSPPHFRGHSHPKRQSAPRSEHRTTTHPPAGHSTNNQPNRICPDMAVPTMYISESEPLPELLTEPKD